MPEQRAAIGASIASQADVGVKKYDAETGHGCFTFSITQLRKQVSGSATVLSQQRSSVTSGAGGGVRIVNLEFLLEAWVSVC